METKILSVLIGILVITIGGLFFALRKRNMRIKMYKLHVLTNYCNAFSNYLKEHGNVDEVFYKTSHNPVDLGINSDDLLNPISFFNLAKSIFSELDLSNSVLNITTEGKGKLIHDFYTACFYRLKSELSSNTSEQCVILWKDPIMINSLDGLGPERRKVLHSFLEKSKFDWGLKFSLEYSLHNCLHLNEMLSFLTKQRDALSKTSIPTNYGAGLIATEYNVLIFAINEMPAEFLIIVESFLKKLK